MSLSIATKVRLKWALKKYAQAHGIPVPRGFFAAWPGVGKPARALISAVQRHAFGVNHVSGEFDERTRILLLPPTLGQSMLKLATTYLGVHENPMGSNDGIQVNIFQSSTGAYNLPWCASFISYIAKRCGWQGTPTARAYTWLELGVGVPLASAQPGDIVVFGIEDGHVGFFVSQTAALVETIDGNTGDSVARRWRPKSVVRGVRRLAV